MYSKSQVGLKAHGLREANSELLYELQVALNIGIFLPGMFFSFGETKQNSEEKVGKQYPKAYSLGYILSASTHILLSSPIHLLQAWKLEVKRCLNAHPLVPNLSVPLAITYILQICSKLPSLFFNECSTFLFI